jgi:uncharacterized protein (DUF1330 family)
VAVDLCVLLWARLGKEHDLTVYEDRVLALLPAHGARVRQRVRPLSALGEPTEVQLLEFPSEEALDAYMTDVRRTALAADREAAVERSEVLRVHVVS